MGKGEELWDDSALITAFDNAISKYKKMHRQGGRIASAEEGKMANGSEENMSSFEKEERLEDERPLGKSDDNKNTISTKSEIGETRNKLPLEGTSCTEPVDYENHPSLSNSLTIQAELPTYADPENLADYGNLLNKYYELEEQRQKILEQLNQSGYYNYQTSGSSKFTLQEQPQNVAQACCPMGSYVYCPYGCQSWVGPCSSPVCCSSVPCLDKIHSNCNHDVCNVTSASVEVHDYVKTAMTAAEKALTSLKGQASDQPDGVAEEGKDNLRDGDGSETDLSVVLNAWYSAGFYTGKYLSEQSYAKKRHA